MLGRQTLHILNACSKRKRFRAVECKSSVLRRRARRARKVFDPLISADSEFNYIHHRNHCFKWPANHFDTYLDRYPNLRLSLVCRQIYHEASHIFWDSITLIFTQVRVLQDFIKYIEREPYIDITRIKRLYINIHLFHAGHAKIGDRPLRILSRKLRGLYSLHLNIEQHHENACSASVPDLAGDITSDLLPFTKTCDRLDFPPQLFTIMPFGFDYVREIDPAVSGLFELPDMRSLGHAVIVTNVIFEKNTQYIKGHICE